MRKIAFHFMVALFGAAFCGFTQTSQVIYEENFNNGYNFESGWVNWSWQTNLSTSTVRAFRGTNCLQATYTAQWAGLYFNASSGFYTGGYDALTLAIYGGLGQQLTLQLKDVNGNSMGSVNPADFIAGGAIPANTWVNITIPLWNLNAMTANVYGVIIMNAAPASTTMYFDSIKFDNAGIAFPGNVYSEAPAPGWLNYSWAQTTFYGTGPQNASWSGARHGYKVIEAYFPNQWDGVYLYNATGISTSPYLYLLFSAKGMTYGYQDLAAMQIQLRRPDQTTIGSVQLSNYLVNGPYNAVQWYDFAIPLSDFGAQNATLGGVVLMRSDPSYSANVWFDDINVAQWRRYSPSGNKRRNVVLEAFYALHPIHDGAYDKVIGSSGASTWNNLNDDATFYSSDSGIQDNSSFGTLKTAYGCYSSDWVTTTSDVCYLPQYDTNLYPIRFYSFAANYGFGPWGGSYGAIGRGGQCTYFANLLLYRSGADKSVFPGLATMWSYRNMNLQTAKEGDVLQVYGDPSFTNHVAVIVQLNWSGSTIVSVDVVDADYIRDISDSTRREVIARHTICVTSACTTTVPIQGHYGVYTGTAYYGTNYDPTN